MSLAHAAPAGQSAAPAPEARKRGWTGYLLLLPAMTWLTIFFVVPLLSLLNMMLLDPSGSAAEGYKFAWDWGNFTSVIRDYVIPHPWWHLTGSPFLRSMIYAGAATIACILLGYPLAYAIAFKSGRWKNLMLVAVIAPFFTSFLIRTLSWQLILGDQGWVTKAANWLHITDVLSALGLVDGSSLLFSPLAVVTGLTYNFLPFMVLPLYTSLEKIDPRLHEAGADLYASPFTTFRKVTLPLSMPGLVAGTLLTFIPAAGDYINARLLGNTNTTMIGYTIQTLFGGGSYPEGAALSVLLMAVIVVLVLFYVRRAGTEDLV